MTWLQRYKIRHYLRNSIWIMPTLGMFVALAAAPLIDRVETAFGVVSNADPDAARAVLDTLASSMFTFIVFVCSALLIAVQLASAQLTPRIIAIMFRDPGMKWSLTVFVFSFTFTLVAMVRVNSVVPLVTTKIAGYCCLASLVMFLFLIDRVGKSLRPSGALRSVALLGREVIESVYPRKFAVDPASPEVIASPLGEATMTVVCRREGALLAFDIDGLMSLAQRAECVIELVPQVGDFVSIGTPLFRVYQNGAALDEHALRQSLCVGQERTLEQDPALTFRIMVDIASKGLSAAINDPTTAVLAIDQIHHLLRNVGSRRLDDGRLRNASGRVCVLYRTPAWEDFVSLAVTEIRHFGGQSIQIARRLKAMLEDLIETLPAPRAPLLRQELDLLRRSTERFFPEPEDRLLAGISDSQGVGSHCRPNGTAAASS